MSDQLYCLSDPEEPGLVRMVLQRGRNRRNTTEACKPGEQIDWSLEVRDARSALRSLHRTMRRYRKNRGGGIYRCSARDAREIVMRYSAQPATGWSTWLAAGILWRNQNAPNIGAESDRSIV